MRHTDGYITEHVVGTENRVPQVYTLTQIDTDRHMSTNMNSLLTP